MRTTHVLRITPLCYVSLSSDYWEILKNVFITLLRCRTRLGDTYR